MSIEPVVNSAVGGAVVGGTVDVAVLLARIRSRAAVKLTPEFAARPRLPA